MKRLAVCFFGQVRFYESFNLFYPALVEELEDYKVDFFLSTWDDCDKTKINLDFAAHEFLNLCDTDIDESEAHTKKAMYLISRVGLLKRKHELENNFSYDKVLLIRPDVGFSIKEFADKIRQVSFTKEDRPTVYIARDYELQPFDDHHIKRLHEDWFFLSSSDAFDIHTTLYNFIYRTQRWRYSTQKLYIGGHWNHLFYFEYFNFNIKVLDLSTIIIRPTRDLEVYKSNFIKDDLVVEVVRSSKQWEVVDKTEELKHIDGTVVPFKGRVV
jgi:hypothetical protein